MTVRYNYHHHYYHCHYSLVHKPQTYLEAETVLLGWLNQKFINTTKSFFVSVLKLTCDSFSYLLTSNKCLKFLKSQCIHYAKEKWHLYLCETGRLGPRAFKVHSLACILPDEHPEEQ